MKKHQWSDAEKITLAKNVLIAQKHNKALASVFDIVSERIGRKSSAVGMFYYNNFRYEMDTTEYTFTKEEEESLLRKLEGSRDYALWTNEEEELVREYTSKALTEGSSLSDVWIQIKRHMPHRSISSISAFYYRNIRGSEGTTSKETKRDNNKADVELKDQMNILQNKESVPAVENIITALIGLANNEQAYRKTQLELEKVLDENSLLKNELSRIKQEYNTLKERLVHIEEQYENAQGLFNTFVNMASISQIMGLGDFKEQMKTTIDKWGNVLKTEVHRVS